MNVLIKFSGEFFTEKDDLTREGLIFLKQITNLELKSAYIVVGGGNRVRGKLSRLNRSISDRLGVLSTLMNGYILREYLQLIGYPAVLFSHFDAFGQRYFPQDAMMSFEAGHWVVLGSGLGTVGYVSTDLSSVIKSLELNVEAMIKVTKVQGVYNQDPALGGASLLRNISYEELLEKKLSVLDLSAVSIAAENNLPIGVCSVLEFEKFMNGEDVGSIIGYDWRK